MNRLTGRNKNGDYVLSKSVIGKGAMIIASEITDKLGQLEDIEEELGIDLITVFKALKDGIYWVFETEKNRYIKHTEKVKALRLGERGWFIHEGWFDLNCPITLYLKDYGKTWALTKEELK